ncbi:MAG TPA: thioredoxin TrxC [Caulobacteraceae bacterium]|nr:thioredoxin TrxC [Caulobacteraceae bacterium]
MTDKLQTVCAHCGAVNRVPEAKLGDAAAAAGAKCGKCGQALLAAHPAEIPEPNFARFVGESDIPVLVDFWAPWCGPCRALTPIVDRVARRLSPRVRFAKVNIDNAQALAGRLNIQAVPTLVVFQRGREIARTSGVMPEAALTDWTKRAAGVTA